MAAADPLQHHHASANVLGKFKLIAELGRGGMSEVYLAVIAGPAGFNKLVVIKLIKGELAEDPEFITMFLEEARLSARLSHPNVVQTNEVGEVGGRYYIAMEYLEGQPYSRILHRLGRDRGLPLGGSLRILSDVLSGLHYAHELTDFDGSPLSVVHRDVTPHNVFVTYDGQVKVVDFGIAKAMNSSHETRTGMLKGKVGYMAPEQAKGERVDRRADIFSVGVMLWEAAVGRRLWKGLNEVQILHQLLSGEVPSPRSMRPDISQRLESIIMRALASDRDRRHGSALELQADLEELMDSGSDRATLREVGRLLSQTFEEERKKLKVIIEQQVAKSAMLATGLYQQMAIPQVEQPPAYTGEVPRLSFSPGSSSLPQLGMHQGSSSAQSYLNSQYSNPQQPHHSHITGSHPSVSMHGVHPSQLAPGMQMVGPHSSLPRLAPPMSGSEPGHSSQPSVSSSIAHASVSQHMPVRPAAGSKLTMVALAIAAAAGGLAALLYVGFGRGTARDGEVAKPAETTKVEATATATAGPAPTTPAPSATTQTSTTTDAKVTKVHVEVTPDTADIFIDGKKVGTGSIDTTLPMDDKEHELKVDAAGYSAKTRKVAANEPSVSWEPELAAHSSSVKGTPKATPTADPAPTGNGRDKNGKIKRDIDKSYPGG